MQNVYSSDAISTIMPKKLKEFRKNSGLTIKQVGGMLNKTTAAVSLWEKGKALPDVNTLIKLCKIYNIADLNLFLEPQTPPEVTILTKSEQELIKLWRAAKPQVRASIKNLLQECNKNLI